MLELAVYAVIAAFFISKLYSVLGKGGDVVLNEEVSIKEDKLEIDKEMERYPQFKASIDAILKKDCHFSLTDFVTGAEKAFDLILKAINRNDVTEIESLLSNDLYKSLKDEIDSRIRKNELYQTTVVSILSKEIQSINLIDNSVTIVIKFISKKINLIKCMSTGEITRGDPLVTGVTEDSWSFCKKSKSGGDRQWLLVAV